MKAEGTLTTLRKWIGNILFSVYVLVIMVDPTNALFHLKEIVFALFIAFNMVAYKPNLHYLVPILAVYAVLILTATLSQMQMAPVSEADLIYTFKSFLPLILLLWVEHYNVIRLSYIPAVIVAFLYAILYVLVNLYPDIEAIVYQFSSSHDDILMMSHRYFYGIPVFAVYMRSTACFTIILFSFYYAFFHHIGNRIFMFIASALVTLIFFGTGSRATMLLPICLLVFVFYNKVKESHTAKYFLYPIIGLLGMLFIIFVAFLAMEKGESSNVIKYAHLTSYAQLFTDHPLYMLIGEGPGSKFYSIGFHRYTALTEWTYFELLRNYGIFAIVPLGVVLYPLGTFFRHRKDNYTFGIMGAYISYLLVAGTNPLLFSSTGMLVLWSAYSYRYFILEKEQTTRVCQKE